MIPLNIQQCINCEAVICLECRHKIFEDTDKLQKEQSELHPNSGAKGQASIHACCPQCKENESLTLVPLKNGIAK